ncbi:MAG: VanW family protein [Patescibacteria group bacterium]|jgi:vancomycin resistance protein YoaR
MKIKFKKIIFISLDVFLFLILFLSLTYLIFSKVFDNCVYLNVYSAGINFSGLDEEEAKNLLKQRIEKFDFQGFKIKLSEREITWHNSVSSFDPDLSFQPVVFDVDKTVENIYYVGREGELKDFFVKIKSLFFKTEVPLVFNVDKNQLLLILEDNFSDLENPAQEAKLSFHKKTEEGETEELDFFIEPESFGYKIDREDFLLEFEENISLLKNNDIFLKLVDDQPLLTENDVIGLDSEAEILSDLAPFNLIYQADSKNFAVSVSDFSSWIILTPNIVNGKTKGGALGLDFSKFSAFLDEFIKPEINVDPVLPNFEFKDGRVVSFVPGADGLKLNYENSFSNLTEAFEKRNMADIFLEVEVEEIEKVDGINDLGIKEIIGTGHSNFAGSPVNRRHNIKVGASKLHGLIIKPDEEFSLVKALGETTKEAGYLPELVIKGNKTVPEYGGGLCQIATTMFRSALAVGLPITERRNHSYRVSYYEPAGTDATIYSPRPDLKFKNDTGNNILIQARFEGSNDIYFDFWGESDGRMATTTYPVIYNIVQPGPTQIIETTDLAPGEKKCTERAHSGAEAYFDYTVIYNYQLENENKIEQRIYSKYVPWREVCLVGVEPKAEEEAGTEEEVAGESEGN